MKDPAQDICDVDMYIVISLIYVNGPPEPYPFLYGKIFFSSVTAHRCFDTAGPHPYGVISLRGSPTPNPSFKSGNNIYFTNIGGINDVD